MAGDSMRTFKQSLILLFLVSITGCFGASAETPQLGQVAGTVKLDGSPCGNLFVAFEPEQGRRSVATTNQDGHYELEFASNIKGALPGKHKVIITAIAPEADSQPSSSSTVAIPDKYNSKTSLSADVASGKNEINFELKSK